MPGLLVENTQHLPDSRNAGLAPTYTIPSGRIVEIEHPCIVRNLDNGIKSLGGEPQMKHVLEHSVGDSLKNPDKPLEEPQVGVSLRPRDPFAKRLESTGVETRNVLVKITLPKRTGRKRKRGSDEPFTMPDDSPPLNDSITAPELLSRLRDNPEKYNVTPVGNLNETHRFRSLPDFQLSARSHPTMRELASHAFPPNHAALSKFHVPLDPGAAHIHEFPAPPSFTSTHHPHLYQYTQAAGVKIEETEHGTTVRNHLAPPRRIVRPIDPDGPIPHGPPPELKKHLAFGPYLDAAIKALAALLDERPLVTRRVALNAIPHFSDTVFKEATQWVGYSFRAGPWRDSLIKYGVDPRSDPKYRFYQTLMFQLDGMIPAPDTRLPGSSKAHMRWNRSVRHVPDGWQSHVFDGEHVTLNGKTWQIIDLTDPMLAKILNTETLPETCDVNHFGWYHNGTLCKARAIMKDKMECLFAGAEPNQAAWKHIASFPEIITQERTAGLYVGKTFVGMGKAQELGMEVRNMARGGRKILLTRAAEKEARDARERGEDVSEEAGGDAVGGDDGEQAGDDGDEDDALDPALRQENDEMAGDFDDEDGGEEEPAEGEDDDQGDADDADDGDDPEADLEAVGELDDGEE